MEYVGIGVRCALGLVFVVSFVSKVRSRDSWVAFTGSVRALGVRSARLVRPAAVAVVIAEFAVVVLVAVPVPGAAVVGCVLAAGLLLVFGTAIAATLRRGVRASCRCFGASAAPLGVRHVVRNAVLAVAAVAGVVASARSGSAEAAGVAVAVCAGLLAGGLVTVLDDVVDLFRSSQPV